MNASRYKTVRDLDTPVPIFSWDPIEVIAAVLLVGVGFVIRMELFGFLSAYILLKVSKHLKKGAKRGQMQHLLWRVGLEMDPLMKKKGLPAPFHVEFSE